MCVDDQLFAELKCGTIRALRRLPDGSIAAPANGPIAIVSGSFNPLHRGHRLLRSAAESHLGRKCVFELSIENADKPTLGLGDLRLRLAQFDDAEVLVTRAAVFSAKARLFPDSVFVVGSDTAARILDDRYYESPDDLSDSLSGIRALGCRFLVAGRTTENRFETLDSIPVPGPLQGLFTELPERDFRCDVSSTQLRRDRTRQQDDGAV